MDCNERGVALVSVVVLLSLLLLLAHILAEKVWQSTRQGGAAASREQLRWAAQAGIEGARSQLAAGYAGSGGWQSWLADGSPLGYPAAPAWVSEVNGLAVEIFLRDNPDGDGDAHSDNDLKLFVLARARSSAGAEAMIESLCGFVLPAAAGPAQPPVAGGPGLAGLPVSSYGLAD